MFKKWKKKRLSLKFKKKSTSLKDINVVGTFVLQTAKIMSVSAESLDSLNCNSTSLVSILDQVFQPNTNSSTTPTSLVCSPKRNSLFNSQSNRSVSANSSSIVTELFVNHCNHEEKIPDALSMDIEVITEENTSFSENISFSCINPMENSVHIITDSPFKQIIVKPLLKKCYSFNDIDIRDIKTFNKKSESIQTFITTNETLPVEIWVHRNSDEKAYREYEEHYDAEQDILSSPEIQKKEFNLSNFSKLLFNSPILLTSIVFGGIFILIPTCRRLSTWFSSAIRPPFVLPQSTIKRTIPIKDSSTSYLFKKLLDSKKTFNIFFSHSQRI